MNFFFKNNEILILLPFIFRIISIFFQCRYILILQIKNLLSKLINNKLLIKNFILNDSNIIKILYT